MPVKDDYTCMLILDEIIHACGLCDTEKDIHDKIKRHRREKKGQKQ